MVAVVVVAVVVKVAVVIVVVVVIGVVVADITLRPRLETALCHPIAKHATPIERVRPLWTDAESVPKMWGKR